MQNAKCSLKHCELSFFLHKIAIWIVIVSCQCLFIKTLISDFRSIDLRNDCNNFSVNGSIPQKLDDTPDHARNARCDVHRPFSGYTSIHRELLLLFLNI